MDGSAIHEPRERRIALPARGGEMAALEFGPQDQPIDVVFSHANGFNARTYRTILAPLAGELRILAIDLRGHGRTSLPLEMEGRFSWSDIRDDLLALLEALDLTGVILAGHSIGATTSLLAAALSPARVRELVLFEPVILPPEMIERAMTGELLYGPMVDGALKRRTVFADRQTAWRAYHGRGAFKTWTDAMLADYVADGFRDLPDGHIEIACPPDWEASSYKAQGNDVWGAFQHSLCPIRLYKAEHASSCRMTAEQALEIGSGRIEVTAIPNATHFLPMEQPGLVQEALRAAVGRV